MNVHSDIHKKIIELGERENFQVLKISPLAGGSINEVFLLDTSLGKRVVKLNDSSRFPGMFNAEALGLKTLKATATIDIPQVFSTGEIGNSAFLLLEFKPSRNKQPVFWEEFARLLAALHKNTSPNFGFPSSNYIGSLPQINEEEPSAADFYIHQRLEPQLKMAADRGYALGKTDMALRNISENIPQEAPALIHGDLWNGNYLVNEKGLPCLIDPAVSYAHREMDLAMMKLFGGFPNAVFEEYSAQYPLEPGFAERASLWQLYYLLVHLNIFGSSYLSPVKEILQKYS